MDEKGHIIAIIADVDYTLTPHFMQKPLFEHFNHDFQQFWDESKEEHRYLGKILSSEKDFPKELQTPMFQLRAEACYEITYADLIIDHIKKGCPRTGKKWEGLNRLLLRKLGSKIKFFEGLPEAIREEKEFVKNHPKWKKFNIKLEWYAISLGIADMIRGSAIGPYLDGVFAYEFAPAKEDHPTKGIINKVATPMLFAGKPQYLYQLNKGPLVDVNEKMAQEIRRIPFQNMLYLGDGQSDVPAFAVIKRNLGRNIAVYSPYEARCYIESVKLYSQKRVDHIAIANYQRGSILRKIIRQWITEVAERIVAEELNTKQDL
ncbi:MAG: hypothetical protein V1914_01270 [archaeon]